MTQRPTEEAEDQSPLFSPPLYRQRYSFVRDLLVRHDVTSVVDFGCAEPKLLAFLKFCPNMESLIGENKGGYSREFIVKLTCT